MIRSAPPAALSVVPHSFRSHADLETLLESAVRAALPLHLVNDAGVGAGLVLLLALQCPLEELLARLASQQPIVQPAHIVSAHWTQLPSEILCLILTTL